MRKGLDDLMILAVGMATTALLAGCPPKDEDPAVRRGRVAYLGTCIACHNQDPALDGAIGPAIAGSSQELLLAKIVKGEYPAGYKPKRDTKVMPPQPQLEAAVADLAAFLGKAASPKQPDVVPTTPPPPG